MSIKRMPYHHTVYSDKDAESESKKILLKRREGIVRYLRVPTENLEKIQDEIYSLFPSDLMSQSVLHYVTPIDFIKKPNLKSYLEKTECIDHIESMAFIVFQPYCVHSIHIDSGPAQYSLNIPVKNCKNTYVNFYQNNGPIEKKLTPNKLTFYKYDPKQCVIIDRAEMSIPHMINVKHPHNVVNENDTVRIAFLIRLKKNAFK